MHFSFPCHPLYHCPILLSHVDSKCCCPMSSDHDCPILLHRAVFRADIVIFAANSVWCGESPVECISKYNGILGKYVGIKGKKSGI